MAPNVNLLCSPVGGSEENTPQAPHFLETPGGPARRFVGLPLWDFPGADGALLAAPK